MAQSASNGACVVGSKRSPGLRLGQPGGARCELEESGDQHVQKETFEVNHRLWLPQSLR